jgi:hypothetical protein
MMPALVMMLVGDAVVEPLAAPLRPASAHPPPPRPANAGPPGRPRPAQSLHIWHIWDRAAEAILLKQQELAQKGWPENTTIVLDLPCPFLSIM